VRIGRHTIGARRCRSTSTSTTRRAGPSPSRAWLSRARRCRSTTSSDSQVREHYETCRTNAIVVRSTPWQNDIDIVVGSRGARRSTHLSVCILALFSVHIGRRTHQRAYWSTHLSVCILALFCTVFSAFFVLVAAIARRSKARRQLLCVPVLLLSRVAPESANCCAGEAYCFMGFSGIANGRATVKQIVVQGKRTGLRSPSNWIATGMTAVSKLWSGISGKCTNVLKHLG